jgi:hypothetical protein
MAGACLQRHSCASRAEFSRDENCRARGVETQGERLRSYRGDQPHRRRRRPSKRRRPHRACTGRHGRPPQYELASKADRVEQDIPVNHSEFFAPVIEPTLSTGTRALVVAALAYLVEMRKEDTSTDSAAGKRRGIESLGGVQGVCCRHASCARPYRHLRVRPEWCCGRC